MHIAILVVWVAGVAWLRLTAELFPVVLSCLQNQASALF
jgi:hypothetical protein